MARVAETVISGITVQRMRRSVGETRGRTRGTAAVIGVALFGVAIAVLSVPLQLHGVRILSPNLCNFGIRWQPERSKLKLRRVRMSSERGGGKGTKNMSGDEK